jgi:hypothetical protein
MRATSGSPRIHFTAPAGMKTEMSKSLSIPLPMRVSK